MSIYSRGQPVANHQFRDSTERNAGSMENVRSIPKRCMCVICKKQRTEATGNHTQAGFICGMCGGVK